MALFVQSRVASITVAEGEKQAAIPRAEASRQAQVLQADRYADALQRIFVVTRTLDAKTMGLQYLDTLKQIGNSPSTKYIFPMEFTNLMGTFRNLMTPAAEPKGDSRGDMGGRQG